MVRASTGQLQAKDEEQERLDEEHAVELERLQKEHADYVQQIHDDYHEKYLAATETTDFRGRLFFLLRLLLPAFRLLPWPPRSFFAARAVGGRWGRWGRCALPSSMGEWEAPKRPWHGQNEADIPVTGSSPPLHAPVWPLPLVARILDAAVLPHASDAWSVRSFQCPST